MTAADLRRRLVDDSDHARRFMVAVIADARRIGAEVPIGVTASVEVWRAWHDRLQTWAGEDAKDS